MKFLIIWTLGLAACASPPSVSRVGAIPISTAIALPAPTARELAAAPAYPMSAAPRAPASAEVPALGVPFRLIDAQSRSIAVYPPAVFTARANHITVLHATCMRPEWVCDTFGEAGRSRGRLLCPAGPSTCYGEPDWSGTAQAKSAYLSAAFAQVEGTAESSALSAEVLFGWSRGAFAARDILGEISAGKAPANLNKRFGGLVVMAAAVAPDPAMLRKVGIRRVLFAGGDADGSVAVMKASAKALERAGFEVRYVSLGNIGHVWPSDFAARMGGHLDWISDLHSAQ